ncbi:MAG: serine hydrolase [Fimbriimonadaceae bacterium]|nr:serine hydrolase [Fimbriimonadaceae bacterium]
MASMVTCVTLLLALFAPPPISPAQVQAAAEIHNKHNGTGLVIRQGGRTLHESYGRGCTASTQQPLNSGTKTFTGIAALLLHQENVIRLDSKVGDYVPHWASDRNRREKTVRELLSLSSGLVSNGLVQDGGPSWQAQSEGRIALLRRFNYGAAPFSTYGHAYEVKTGKSFEEFMEQRIFDPIGVRVGWRWRCEDGRAQLGGGAIMTTGDWATFGDFLLRRGRVGDRHLIESRWFDEITRPGASEAYGLAAWLKLDADPLSGTFPGNDLPTERMMGFYMAAGAGNQRLYILPAMDLVVARNATGNDRSWSDREFLKALVAAKE